MFQLLHFQFRSLDCVWESTEERWLLTPMWETQMEFLLPGLASAIVDIWGNKQGDKTPLSLSLFLSNIFKEAINFTV